MGTTSVDPYALRFAALRLDEAADLLDTALNRHLRGLRLFGADTATRSAVGSVVQGVARWRQAAREYASAVAAGADRYVDEDRNGAGALG